ncbi:unnamed protein product [marine sediment metagenome]|uniref:Helix-turn-helix domain-containing protein n=1 Tax=marine sediment metagenome TaxID=412755 RepID=X0ZYH9_9ZZZZ
MINEYIHYRLPLKLINSYTWANLIKPAKAILPILGAYANKDGKAWPGVKIIAELAGYRDPRYRKIRYGMENLIKNKLVIREKPGRHYVYYLTSLALRKGRESFFPIYKEAMIISRKWARLTSSEKSLYPVLGNKAKVNDPDAMDTEFHAIGNIYEFNKYVEWSGISRPSFDSAYQDLNHKNLIAFWPKVDFGKYGIYVPR